MMVIAAALRGQTPQPEIRGVVLAVGTNQPIPGARVTLAVRTIKDGPNTSSPPGETTTDALGAFRFQLPFGAYSLGASKDGYVNPQGGVANPLMTLDRDHPT